MKHNRLAPVAPPYLMTFNFLFILLHFSFDPQANWPQSRFAQATQPWRQSRSVWKRKAAVVSCWKLATSSTLASLMTLGQEHVFAQLERRTNFVVEGNVWRSSSLSPCNLKMSLSRLKTPPVIRTEDELKEKIALLEVKGLCINWGLFLCVFTYNCGPFSNIHAFIFM